MIDYSASALYDGGWRASDIEDLAKEYDLTQSEKETILEELLLIEADDKENE